MKVIHSPRAMQEEAERLRIAGTRIAVVPTMGALHAGHAGLIARARELAECVVTTIFVNPTQFGPHEDFERYPRDFERDRTIARDAGASLIFSPETKNMYPEGFATFVGTEGVSTVLEGAVRPAHFRGVTTVVAKLLHLTKPHVAVFGQKDAQQAFIIRKMVRELNMDVEIEVVPTVREPDGLAVSSRNAYLSPDERTRAVILFQALHHAGRRIGEGERSVPTLRKEMEHLINGARPSGIDYIAFLRPSDFSEIQRIEPPEVLIALAVRFGTTRLIDNLLVEVPLPS
ncbi:MAG: pantoate--beta-alanine ligase [Bacteroidota bacterium]